MFWKVCLISAMHYVTIERAHYHCSLLIPTFSFPLAVYLLIKHPEDKPLRFFMFYYLTFHMYHLCDYLVS